MADRKSNYSPNGLKARGPIKEGMSGPATERSQKPAVSPPPPKKGK